MLQWQRHSSDAEDDDEYRDAEFDDVVLFWRQSDR